MIALTLLDLAVAIFHEQEPKSNAGREALNRLSAVANSVVASLNEQFDKIRELDSVFAPAGEKVDEDHYNTSAAIALRRMYEQCALDAEAALYRIDRLEREGLTIKRAQLLRDSYRRAKAILSISLEDIAHSREEIRLNKVTSAEQMRREYDLASGRVTH